MIRAMIARSGIPSCFRAAAAFAGLDSSSTSPAATIEPVPTNTIVRPTVDAPTVVTTIPAAVTIARNRL